MTAGLNGEFESLLESQFIKRLFHSLERLHRALLLVVVVLVLVVRVDVDVEYKHTWMRNITYDGFAVGCGTKP